MQSIAGFKVSFAEENLKDAKDGTKFSDVYFSNGCVKITTFNCSAFKAKVVLKLDGCQHSVFVLAPGGYKKVEIIDESSKSHCLTCDFIPEKKTIKYCARPLFRSQTNLECSNEIVCWDEDETWSFKVKLRK